MKRAADLIAAILPLGLLLLAGLATVARAAPRQPVTPAKPAMSAPRASAANGTTGAAASGAAKQSAAALFSRYQDLEHAFDPALVDLYADDARIVSRVIVPGRPPTVRKWSGQQYKELLGRALKKAKEKKQDLNYYSATTYLDEGDRVRIKTLRYAELQKAVSPVELLVGPDSSGTWRIFEELSESHPLTSAPPAKPR
jgi:hypothetical protein